MKANNIFVAQLHITKCKISQIIPQKIYLTFRIGKSMTQTTITRIAKDGQIDIDATLQLNTDKLALDTQRSSLTLSSIGPNNQITVFGMVMIALPKEAGEWAKRCKVTQCQDKSAEIWVQVLVKPLDLGGSGENKKVSITNQSSGISSSRSLKQLPQLEMKTLLPSKIHQNLSQKELPPPSLNPSPLDNIKQSQELRESVSRLEDECKCLKEVLKVELKRGDESNRLIEELMSVLEASNQHEIMQADLDETLLLDGIEKEDSYEQILQRNRDLQKQIENLNATIHDLRQQNKSLLSAQAKTTDTTRTPSREINANRVQPKQFNEATKQTDKLMRELSQFEEQFVQRFEQGERYKRKMKISAKLPILEPIHLEKQISPLVTLRTIMEVLLNQNKEMIKIILKYVKYEADNQAEGLLAKAKARVQRTFTNLISKKMNREILLGEKAQLVRGLEELWQKG